MARRSAQIPPHHPPHPPPIHGWSTKGPPLSKSVSSNASCSKMDAAILHKLTKRTQSYRKNVESSARGFPYPKRHLSMNQSLVRCPAKSLASRAAPKGTEIRGCWETDRAARPGEKLDQPAGLISSGKPLPHCDSHFCAVQRTAPLSFQRDPKWSLVQCPSPPTPFPETPLTKTSPSPASTGCWVGCIGL